MPVKLIVLFTLLISLSIVASKKAEEIIGVKATKVQIAELYDILNIVG